MGHGWINMKKIKTDCNCGFRELVRKTGEIGEKLFRVTKKKANTQKRHTSWPSSIMHL